MSEARDRIREIAASHRARGDETAWFESVYVEADGDRARIAWADGEPNPHVLQWFDAESEDQRGEVLEVGCGLGDTSEALAARGLRVTAFDVSPTAVAWCHRRFPSSPVGYAVADLFALSSAWNGRFAMVVECYTLQVLPAPLRAKAMEALTRSLAPGGRILVVCRARDESEDEGELPWPLTSTELQSFESPDLTLESATRFFDDEEPPTSRFRAVYCKRNEREGQE